MNRSKKFKILHYEKSNLKIIIVLLFFASMLSIVFAIGIGPVSIHPVNVVKIVLSKIPFINDHIVTNWTQLEENIVWGLRMPRVLLGMIVGASLAITGVAMQALVRNHLADPFILGVSSGASATATLGDVIWCFFILWHICSFHQRFYRGGHHYYSCLFALKGERYSQYYSIAALGRCHRHDNGCDNKHNYLERSKCARTP